MNISSIAQDRKHWRTLQGKRAPDKPTGWWLFTQAISLLPTAEGTALGKGTPDTAHLLLVTGGTGDSTTELQLRSSPEEGLLLQ